MDFKTAWAFNKGAMIFLRNILNGHTDDEIVSIMLHLAESEKDGAE